MELSSAKRTVIRGLSRATVLYDLAGRSPSGATVTMLLRPTGEGWIQMRPIPALSVPAVIAGNGLMIHPATVGTRLRGSQRLPRVALSGVYRGFYLFLPTGVMGGEACLLEGYFRVN